MQLLFLVTLEHSQEVTKFMATQTVKPTVQIGDEVRQMNDAEFAQYKIDQAANTVAAKAQAEAQIAKATARQALLEKLGITEEEAQLLLGGI
jgi:signal-transduction protein with cAMP-binding, CBS, and nucleotidyltransferase domain